MGTATVLSIRGRAALPRAPLIAGTRARFAANAFARTAPDLGARYLTPSASPTDSDMRPHFEIIASGTPAIPLTELTLHYWFTEGGTQTQTFNSDWTARDCNNVTSKFVSLASQSANAPDFVLAAVPTGVTVAQRGTATSALGIAWTSLTGTAGCSRTSDSQGLLERTASCRGQ